MLIWLHEGKEKAGCAETFLDRGGRPGCSIGAASLEVECLALISDARYGGEIEVALSADATDLALGAEMWDRDLKRQRLQ